MFKKIIAIFAVIAICFTALGCGGGDNETGDLSSPTAKIEQSVLVRPNTNEDFRYNIYTYYVEISECLSTKSNIVIPDTIQDLPVYKICANAFQDQTTITSVTLTNNIIEIGESAFEGCTNLASVSLSDNLEIIGTSAFNRCENLKNVIIPGNVAELNSVFSNCIRLLSVKIEESPQIDENSEPSRILSEAFSGCTALKVVWIPKDFSEISDSGLIDAEDVIICGTEESQAAVFAAENKIDFKTESEFKNLSVSALTTKQISMDETALSTNWKISLYSAYVFGSDFEYINYIKDTTNASNLKPIKNTELVSNNENVVFLAFNADNLSGSEQSINFLDFEINVDGYARRIYSYGEVTKIINSDSTSGINGTLLNGKVAATSVAHGCLAIKVPSNWESISVTYHGDIALEAYSFTIERTNTHIKWFDANNIQSNNTTDNITEGVITNNSDNQTQEPITQTNTIETTTVPETNTTETTTQVQSTTSAISQQ